MCELHQKGDEIGLAHFYYSILASVHLLWGGGVIDSAAEFHHINIKFDAKMQSYTTHLNGRKSFGKAEDIIIS